MIEIGSEFWLDINRNRKNKNKKLPIWLEKGMDQKLLLSGRTAIDFIIKDIKSYRKVKSVYMPAYCCSSMIKPFLDNNIKIYYYNVKYNENGNGFTYNIDVNKNIDIFFSMNYYGYSNMEMDKEIESFKNKNKIVIEDITHSLLISDVEDKIKADYEIASLRKWMNVVSGGIAIKNYSCFNIDTSNFKENKEYTMLKLKAMNLKSEYIKLEDQKLKEVFLEKYNKANKLLSKQYKEFNIDDNSISVINSININKLKEQRIENTSYIYSNIVENKNLKFVYPNYTSYSCPLFIPIKVNENKRNLLRKHLIENKIYCPIHWNYLPDEVDFSDFKTINKTIISLICDQRYGQVEMEYMVNKINDFMQIE